MPRVSNSMIFVLPFYFNSYYLYIFLLNYTKNWEIHRIVVFSPGICTHMILYVNIYKYCELTMK